MSDKEDAYAHAKEVLEGDQKDERKNVVSMVEAHGIFIGSLWQVYTSVGMSNYSVRKDFYSP